MLLDKKISKNPAFPADMITQGGDLGSNLINNKSSVNLPITVNIIVYVGATDYDYSGNPFIYNIYDLTRNSFKIYAERPRPGLEARIWGKYLCIAF
ncbi:hypothetical protein QV05_05080 [Gallibacterium genomosp. 1]|uniref:Uncharacterized protein n=1 Tax=Gallibacterium genomosp. 1 TaxID=155515 RepID=A0AB36DWK7_9PAST|nr:hypothetical protein QV05_05080 [Gallibacterium genomosp. 1]